MHKCKVFYDKKNPFEIYVMVRMNCSIFTQILLEASNFKTHFFHRLFPKIVLFIINLITLMYEAFVFKRLIKIG